MRTINMIIMHCSAVRPWQRSSAADIERWHRERGFSSIGYHYVVRRDGSIEPGRPLQQAGAHCRGYNRHSIGICYEGGLDKNGKAADTRTAKQKAALKRLTEELRRIFPGCTVWGHHDLNPKKACPCFDARKEYASPP
jgi:N-acetyl-anhydromuramyl-L-alanine amidase AmpD